MRARHFSFVLLLALSAQAAVVEPLARQATIRRDRFGVPHILAGNEEAAAFAMGFAQAEDHAIEIARRFLAARSESAKHFGTGLESDFDMKRYGNHDVARGGFPKMDPLMQRIMNAYAAGFNRHVAKHRAELPAWIPVFDGVDVLANGRAEMMRFAFARAQASIRAVQEKYKGAPNPSAPADGEGDFGGSNMWALGPSRTTSGNAILLGNPHQLWSALYWEAHITVAGKINFYGATFAGLPVLRHGFNEHLGWTHTVNYPDLDDIYTLTLDRNRPDHYLFEGKPMPLTPREITVEVQGGAPQRRTYWYSHLGPIVHRTPEKAFSIKSAIFDSFRYYEGWYDMAKSKNLKEFQAVVRRNLLPMFNLSYADAEGNILYVWNGAVPKRLDDGMDYRAEVPGDAGKYVWKEFHTTAELPQLLNPSGGYVQNCNDPPWWTSLRNPLDLKRYPSYHEPGRTLGLRTQMSLEMLESKEKFSLDDVKRLKFNERMLLADRVKTDLIRALDASPGRAALEAWDNTTTAGSRGGVLFQRFWDTYSKAIPQPYAKPWDPANPARTPTGLADPALAARHLEEAVRWTRQTYGSETVAWGEVHRIRRGDLDLPGGGAGGPYGLFRVMDYVDQPGGKRVMQRGDGWIMAVEFSRPVSAWSVLAYGQTSDLKSKHSTDQVRLFAEHQLKPIWFSEAAIQANLERSYRPE